VRDVLSPFPLLLSFSEFLSDFLIYIFLIPGRVSDRADVGSDRKKFRPEPNGDKSIGNATPTKRPNGNQKRREKKKREAEAKAAAAASGSKTTTSPAKKTDQKQEGKDKEGKKEIESKVVAEQSETPDVVVDGVEKKSEPEVVTIDEGGESAPAAGKTEEEKKRKSKYDDFPSALLVCKVCQKSMNDGAVSLFFKHTVCHLNLSGAGAYD